jgi:hypothetical protein
MPRFRSNYQSHDGQKAVDGTVSIHAVRSMVEDVSGPEQFFVGDGLVLEWQRHPAAEASWEVFRGRLLPPAQTRLTRTFETWSVFRIDDGARASEPLLSLKLDRARRQLHVTRGILSQVWEGYHAGDNVYLSRETRKWVQELVGTIELDRFISVDQLRDEIICRLFQAVVGTSRLPLTSLETPLPEFSLGKLAYCYCPVREGDQTRSGPTQCSEDLIAHALTAELAWLEQVKLFETLVRATPLERIGAAAVRFATRWDESGLGRNRLPALLRDLFNNVALSPYTDFVPKALAFVEGLQSCAGLSAEEHVDFLSYILRQLGRHLTAFDLVVFHHQGANYPDILLLDLVLKALLQQVEQRPRLFERSPTDESAAGNRKRLRRRALRHGWMLRRQYEGHLVPDAPTSPGENARILPAPHVHVPEEQITNPQKREKSLFTDDALSPYLARAGEQVLRESMEDLRLPEELRELGMALFLDRPLGVFKAPGEPDQTPILSYEAFSRSIAERRLEALRKDLELLSDAEYAPARDALRQLPVGGITLTPSRGNVGRIGVSVHDASRVAADFLFLRTTARSARDFFALFDFTALRHRLSTESLEPPNSCLILDGSAIGEQAVGSLVVFDASQRRCLDLRIDATHGYESRGGVEYPAAGLEVVCIGRNGEVGEKRAERNKIMIPAVRDFY